jgi:sugar lactone lactonase YvrE
MYIADTMDCAVRRVSTNGTITTVAGTGNDAYSGDGGPATSAELEGPFGVAVDSTGVIYLVDLGRIRKFAPGGIISTVAGTGTPGYSGDGGLATAAQLFAPSGVAVDGAGNLYISDTDNNRIRMVSPGGVISTIAGTGTPGFSGDGGPAAAAAIMFPTGVAVGIKGSIVFSDWSRLRILAPKAAVVGVPQK